MKAYTLCHEGIEVIKSAFKLEKTAQRSSKREGYLFDLIHSF